MAEDGRVTAVTVGAIDAGAEGDGTEIMDRAGIVQGCTMADGAVAAEGMTDGAADQAEVGGAVAEVAVVLMGDGNQVGGAAWIMTGGTGRGGGHIARCLVVRLDVAGVVGGSIGDVAELTINVGPAFAIGNLLLVGGIVAAAAGEGAIGNMFAGAVTVVAVDAGQRRRKVKQDVVVLIDVGIDRIDRVMTELAGAGSIESAAFEHTGDAGVTVVAIALVGIGNEISSGMAARGAGWSGAQAGV